MKAPNGKVSRVASCYKPTLLMVGYTEVKTVAPQKPVNKETEQDNEEVKAYDVTKPIGQWSKEELKAYTDEHEIDTSSAKKIQDVKALVKEHLEG